MKRVALIILFGFLTPSYAEQVSQIQNEYDDDGNLKHSFEVFSMPTGTVMGIIREYYTNGMLRSETPIKPSAGELGYCPEGEVKTYHPNGNTDSIVTFESCAENGPFRRLYSDGTVRAEGVFSNGVIVSVHRTDRNGKPIAFTNHISLVSATMTYSIPNPIRLYCDVNADWHGRFAWLFLYRLDNGEWIEKVRFSDFRPQRYTKGETRVISYPTEGLKPGKWKARLTFSITGPGRGGEFPEVETEPFIIKE